VGVEIKGTISPDFTQGGNMIRLPENSCISAAASLLMLGAMICVSSVNGIEQVRPPRRPDPQVQVLNNYRRYPDRYIRISDETWKYDEPSHTASHSFTLKNIAGVAYSEIEIRLNYLSTGGKSLQSRSLKIPGILAAYQTRKIKDMKVRNVPTKSDQVLVTISKALIHP
jgi:hypothetical protein